MTNNASDKILWDQITIKRFLLKNNQTFYNFSNELMDRILEMGKIQTLSAGQLLVSQTELLDRIYIVLEGSIGVMNYNQRGKELVISIIEPGNIFGLLSVIDNQPSPHYAKLEENSIFFTLEKRIFNDLLNENKEFRDLILRFLCARLRKTFNLFEDYAFSTPKERLRATLVKLATEFGVTLPNGNIFVKTKISQEMLGSMIGVSRQSVNKHIRQLTTEGVLKMERGKITILRLSYLDKNPEDD